nr:MAG TPA: hypothetical protein [Caudoviricetes sp.]
MHGHRRILSHHRLKSTPLCGRAIPNGHNTRKYQDFG